MEELSFGPFWSPFLVFGWLHDAHKNAPFQFVIPKKTVEKPNVDESAIAAFKRRKEEAEREKEREAARKKEELIRLRLEAHGGKVCGPFRPHPTHGKMVVQH